MQTFCGGFATYVIGHWRDAKPVDPVVPIVPFDLFVRGTAYMAPGGYMRATSPFSRRFHKLPLSLLAALRALVRFKPISPPPHLIPHTALPRNPSRQVHHLFFPCAKSHQRVCTRTSSGIYRPHFLTNTVSRILAILVARVPPSVPPSFISSALSSYFLARPVVYFH